MICKFFFLPLRADLDVHLRILGVPITGIMEHPSVADIPNPSILCVAPALAYLHGKNGTSWWDATKNLSNSPVRELIVGCIHEGSQTVPRCDACNPYLRPEIGNWSHICLYEIRLELTLLHQAPQSSPAFYIRNQP